MGFSNKPQYPFRLAIGSFLPDVNNEVLSPLTKIEILQPNEGKYLDKKITFPH
jgi:hypothetical protein